MTYDEFRERAYAARKGAPFHGQTEDVLGCVPVTRSGLWLEFGVAGGTTLRVLARERGAARVVGFDSFKGLPEAWRPGFPVGFFACDPPEVTGAEQLVVGLFADTLPAFDFTAPVTLVHVDCDLYSSARTVLQHVGPHLAPGAVVMFDELETGGAEVHELNALYDAAEAGFEYDWVCQGKDTIRARGPFRMG